MVRINGREYAAEGVKRKPEGREPVQEEAGTEYEFCPRCEANLTLQKGYDPALPYWVCKGCGEMLINPEVEADSGIAWFCDGCGTMLNIQPGFHESCGEWTCRSCGFVNRIEPEEIFLSEEEYLASKRDPYNGLSDEELLKLSVWQEEEFLNGRRDIILVRNRESGILCVKKLLTIYDSSIYAWLMRHPVAGMPEILALYEGSSCLIVIEEYVEGSTVEQLLEQGLFSEERAVRTARQVCTILDRLHHFSTPIIHRDVKPSNIIVTPEDTVILLDVNAAKWYDPDRTDDTRYLGTRFYAAPEQAGYGLSASSVKADIYAVGMLLNVMITGEFPKVKRAGGEIWEVIRRCIRLDPEELYTAEELIRELDRLGKTKGQDSGSKADR